MPKLKITNKNERLRRGFINGIKAQASLHGLTAAQLKHSGSKSYGTTNKRLEDAPGEITVNDLLCFAMATGVSFDEFVSEAAKAAADMAKI